MNFLADQDVYAATIEFVRGLGHDVVTAAQLGMSRADDSDLLRGCCNLSPLAFRTKKS
jgi:hypothetical protein